MSKKTHPRRPSRSKTSRQTSKPSPPPLTRFEVFDAQIGPIVRDLLELAVTRPDALPVVAGFVRTVAVTSRPEVEP